MPDLIVGTRCRREGNRQMKRVLPGADQTRAAGGVMLADEAPPMYRVLLKWTSIESLLRDEN
jgi:hypothetical protein